MTIAVEIRGHQTTGTDMARHVKAFAASYSRWWTYQRHRRDAEFVMLNAAIPIPSRLVRVDNDWKPLKIRVTGYLWGGDIFHADPQGNPAVGFTAHAEHWIELPNGDSVAPRGETVSDHQEYFPCSHVRVPADW